MRKNTTAPAASKDSKEVVEQINALLRGELSACETYRMAAEAMKGDQKKSGVAQRLQSLRREHARAAELLRERIGDLGGEVVESAGLWGTWARLVQGAADLLGQSTALKSLKEGEEHGLKEYRSALGKLDEQTGRLVTGQLVHAQKQHIRALDELMGAKA